MLHTHLLLSTLQNGNTKENVSIIKNTLLWLNEKWREKILMSIKIETKTRHYLMYCTSLVWNNPIPPLHWLIRNRWLSLVKKICHEYFRFPMRDFYIMNFSASQKLCLCPSIYNTSRKNTHSKYGCDFNPVNGVSWVK